MVLKSNAAKVAELVYRIAKFNGAEITDAYCFGGNEEYPDSFSMYFIVKYGLAARKIRISNHTKQHKDAKKQQLLKSITVNEKTTFKDIEKFVLNRINEVKRGSFYAALDYIKKCA